MKKNIAVIGMGCAACAARVEKKLNELDGVGQAHVNYAARTAFVDFDPRHISLQQMKDAIYQIGYDLVVEDHRNVEEIERHGYRQLLYKVILSWLLALLCMSLSMGWTGLENRDYTNQALLILALLNIVYCGRSFYVNTWRQLRQGATSMDTLICLSTLVSFLFSVFNTFWGDKVWTPRGVEWHTYYDASIMIVTFVLTGRLLEARAKNSTGSAIRGLMGLVPKTCTIVEGEQLHEVPIATLKPGDRIRVKPGDKIPVDGQVESGTAYIDESMMTGEPKAVEKSPGTTVLAGTVCLPRTEADACTIRAQSVGEKTVLAHIIRRVQEAQGSKAPIQRTADRVAGIFVPTVIILSLLTFLLWWLIGGQQQLPHAILSAVSVLVIACPCALGLATPTALMVGIGKAARQNILIKDAVALEQLRKVDALVVDKTGTLTIPTPLAADGPKEELKPHAREAIAALRDRGIDIHMMSGDEEATVRHWADILGISHYRSKVQPQDKEDIVGELQAEGKHVAMVGDGINDTQALAAADVSIAMATGTDIAMDVAQVTLMTNDLRRIGTAIDLSRQTVGMIHQNLFWAFIYNVVCIPLAAGLPYLFGYDLQITPMLASVLMACSSLSVVLNSLRLKHTT